MRNLILSAALVTASLFGMTAQAADVPLEAGKTYVELANPVPVSEPGKIEVVELFWYGCPHCYAFEPTINPWAEKLPADVNFKRIPALRRSGYTGSGGGVQPSLRGLPCRPTAQRPQTG
jgi:thiol:disulfide interchange protein DsbA